jgi:hypothetical protein
MPFLSRREVALELRSKAEKEYRQQLRKALSDPSLSAAQRQDIRNRLEQVGKDRVYDADSPPVPGSIMLPDPAPTHTQDELRGMKKTELVTLAGELGLPTSGTKTTLVERILNR